MESSRKRQTSDKEGSRTPLKKSKLFVNIDKNIEFTDLIKPPQKRSAAKKPNYADSPSSSDEDIIVKKPRKASTKTIVKKTVISKEDIITLDSSIDETIIKPKRAPVKKTVRKLSRKQTTTEDTTDLNSPLDDGIIIEKPKKAAPKRPNKKTITDENVISDCENNDLENAVKPKKVASKRATKKTKTDQNLISDCVNSGVENVVKPKKPPTKKVTAKKKTSGEDNIDGNEDVSDDCNYVCESEFPIWDVPGMLSYLSGTSLHVAQNFSKLIEDDNTLPFIARYRKTMVDHMTPESLHDLHSTYTNICQMRKKALKVLDTLKKSENLTPDLQKSIINAKSLCEINMLYDPFKPHSRTLAERARKLGLEQAAQTILSGGHIYIPSLCDANVEGLQNPDEVETNIIHLIAETIYKDFRVLDFIRKLKSETVIYIESSKAKASKAKTSTEKPTKVTTGNQKYHKDGKNDIDKFNLYLEFKMKVDYLKSHQILALNRGEAAKILSVKVSIPDWFYHKLEGFCLTLWRGNYIPKAVTDAYTRYIKPWLSRQVRSDLSAKAEKESIAVFSSNLKRLLMTAPIKGHTILGIDPGFAAGSKVGIIDSSGNILTTCILYPNFNTNASFDKESQRIHNLVYEYKCGVIALGNGTACRETEHWLRKWEVVQNIPLVIVPEQGSSIYSCSIDAAKEHPGMDPKLISAISIARRALDPLSELVKVEPKCIGVGLYQHDVSPKLLNEALTDTVVSCASFVGADLNTASLALLRRIAGLTEKRASAILKYRDEHGAFQSREELLKVAGIGPKVFKQCAGFVRVPHSKNKLDNTWIHPENYKLANRLMTEIQLNMKNLGNDNFISDVRRTVSSVGISKLAESLKCIESDLQLIVDAFTTAPHEDPLRNAKPVYSIAVANIDQIKEGAKLSGVVNNVTPFGCFVDCGTGRNGLIHISQMGGSRIPQLGERVMVTIIPPLTKDRMPLKLDEIL